MKTQSILILTASTLLGGGAFALSPVEPGFVPVYDLSIGTSAAYDNTAVPYTVDNSSTVGSFTRVAYLLTLAGSTNLKSPNGYVYVSFDAITTDAKKIGVPTTSVGAFQQLISNMNVISNVPGVVNGTGISTGNIEFWGTNYAPNNTLPVPGADGNTFDFGDSPSNGGQYGSMQIHNYGASQTDFAFNNWGGNGGTVDVGFGNNPNVNSQPDWTFQGNGTDYTTRDLQVFVLPVAVPEPSTWMAAGGLVLLAAGDFRRRLKA